MKKIICFGDSNTFGYDARSFLGSRYPKNIRWTGILDTDPEYEIINEGENGREIPISKWEISDVDRILDNNPDLYMMTIMLGTNDLLFSFNHGIEPVIKRMDQFLTHILSHPSLAGDGSKLLLIAPPQLELARYGQDNLDALCLELGPAYEKLAKKYGIHYLNAAEFNLELVSDGCHLTPESHKTFALRISQFLKYQE